MFYHSKTVDQISNGIMVESASNVQHVCQTGLQKEESMFTGVARNQSFMELLLSLRMGPRVTTEMTVTGFVKILALKTIVWMIEDEPSFRSENECEVCTDGSPSPCNYYMVKLKI